MLCVLGLHACGPQPTTKIAIENWILCKGLVDHPSQPSCKKTGTPKPLDASNRLEGVQYTYFGTYTMHQDLTREALVLNLGPIGDQDQVWIGAEYIGQTQYGRSAEIGVHDWRTYDLPKAFSRIGKHTVKIWVNHVGPFAGGVVYQKPAVENSVSAFHQKAIYNFFRTFLPFAFAISLIFLALYHALVWFFYKLDEKFIYFSLLSISLALFILSMSFIQSYMGIAWWFTVKLHYVSSVLSGYCIFLFFQHTQLRVSQTVHQILRAVVVGALVFALALRGSNKLALVSIHFFWLMVFMPLFLYAGYVNIRLLLKHRDWLYSAMFLSYGVMVFCMVFDLYQQYMDPGLIKISPYGFTLYILSLSMMLAREHTQALKDQREKKVLQEKVKLDPMTGLYNHESFAIRVDHALQQNTTPQSALLILDIDHFKQYNDAHGHPAGDRMLIDFARCVQNQIRSEDTLARLGGEEFGIFVDMAPMEAAFNIAEKVRHAVVQYPFEHASAQGSPMTVSIGVVHASQITENLSYATMYEKADQAMYQAKQTRNSVVVYQNE